MLTVEAIAGGFTVTEADSDNHWWSVAYRGATPTITSHLCESVDPYSRPAGASSPRSANH